MTRQPKILRRKAPKVTPAEKAIIEAPIHLIINEHNLILDKKSKLSSKLREVVKMRIDFLIEKGFITTEETITEVEIKDPVIYD